MVKLLLLLLIINITPILKRINCITCAFTNTCSRHGQSSDVLIIETREVELTAVSFERYLVNSKGGFRLEDRHFAAAVALL